MKQKFIKKSTPKFKKKTKPIMINKSEDYEYMSRIQEYYNKTNIYYNFELETDFYEQIL